MSDKDGITDDAILITPFGAAWPKYGDTREWWMAISFRGAPRPDLLAAGASITDQPNEWDIVYTPDGDDDLTEDQARAVLRGVFQEGAA